MSVPPNHESPDVLAENLRLKHIIEEQQRQIDAMVVGASMARTSLPAPVAAPAKWSVPVITLQKAGPRKLSPVEHPLLMTLLDLAQRYRLCTASQKQMMLGFVQNGRFPAQYYVDMWTRRLNDLSPQAATSLRKALATGMHVRAVGTLPPENRIIDAAKDSATRMDCATGEQHLVTHRVRGTVGVSRAVPVHEQLSTVSEAAAHACCGEKTANFEAGSYREAATVVTTESVTARIEDDPEWSDAPNELLRRATRTFVQAEESQEMDPSGEWRGKSEGDIVLSKFKLAGQSGTFSLQREFYNSLRPYQRAGVAWMAQLYQAGKGGILADEMGLGKTVQACALLNGIRKAGATHVLIIVPVTLLDQWDREASKWCPSWRVYIYHGSPSQRLRALQGVMAPAGGILLTSYAVLKNADERLLQVAMSEADLAPSGNQCQGSRPARQPDEKIDGPPRKKAKAAAAAGTQLPKRPWDLVICDEAHVMRNISTLLGKHLRSLRSHSRMLLTGTPVQNALQDLWSLMDFAQPGLLGNHATFVKNVSDPIDKGSVRGANPFAVQLKKHLCEQLWDLVKPHMLRRTKDSVGLLGQSAEVAPTPMSIIDAPGQAPLPLKLETVVWLMPTSDQVKATQKLLEKSDVIQEANSHGKMGLAVFRAIALLKKLCNHPALALPVSKPHDWHDFLHEASGKAKGKRKTCSMEQSTAAIAIDTVAAVDVPEEVGADDDVHAGRAVEMMLRKLPRDIDSLISQSAKLRCLSKMLPALGSLGHRTLIFSQGLKMMDLVELCVLKKLGITYLRIDGSTDVQSRADRVQQFQTQHDAFQCMLLSTSVGGFGLNLTSADRVIILDPAWNPAVDAQAVDRVHRIGQRRDVRVYRLVMSGLIEDKVFRLQVFKMGLTKTVLEAKQQQRYFTSTEVRGLFEWTDPSQGETRKLLLDKHGDEQENIAMINAQDDNAHNGGWLEAGPAVGLSNFSMLYNCLAQEDMEPDADCEAQVAEMKAKLGHLDENLRRTVEDREAVDEQLKAAQDGMQDAGKKISTASAARSKAAEQAKRCQVQLTKARRQEAAATQHLDKVMRRRSAAREAKVNAEQARLQADLAAATVGRTTADALVAWHGAVSAMELAFKGAQDAAFVVGEDGKAVQDGQVDVAASKAKAAQKALERARKSWDSLKGVWAALEAAEGGLLQLESAQECHQKDFSRAETAHEKAAQRAESGREGTTTVVSGMVEAGMAFTESFKVANGKNMSATALKTLQQAARANFRLVSTAWIRARQLQEAWVKASSLGRRAAKKLSAAVVAGGEADAWLDAVELEHSDAWASEDRERSSRLAAEQAMLEAEAQRSAAEIEDAGQRCRRSECQAAISSARAKLRPAKFAVKEASSGRASLLNHYSKAEKGQVKEELEAATHSVAEALSAVKALKAEEYDKNQVEDAYQAKKKQRTDANTDAE
jgi:SNF2 family DNA or RNA helicase